MPPSSFVFAGLHRRVGNDADIANRKGGVGIAKFRIQVKVRGALRPDQSRAFFCHGCEVNVEEKERLMRCADGNAAQLAVKPLLDALARLPTRS